MKALPLSLGTIHFVGIGGIGMSGIAEILHNLGYSVQGSDKATSANVRRLSDLGIAVRIGHDPTAIGEAGVVVVSSAIHADNPEVRAARERHIPVVRRAEMLAELMRLKWSIAVGGTHGKTTTTSLVAALLEKARFGPTVINGGIINAYGTNARLGEGDWMVVEADESDGTFTRLPSIIAVVTNIDPEHLDFYGSFEDLRRAFLTFVKNIPFYGFAVLCADHPEVQAMIAHISDRRVLTYGLSPQADVRAANLRFDRIGSTFDVEIRGREGDEPRRIEGLRLPMPGAYNVQNALAAVAIASEMGIPDTLLREALSGFEGVRRRFTQTGEVNGVSIVDDYAHHPVEIAAVLRAAREATEGKVVAVFQPHRYSRVHHLFEEFCTCFNDAETVIVADVYAAGEAPIEGADRAALIHGLKAHGHRNVVELADPERLASIVHRLTLPGDLVVCLGAGSITNWAAALPAGLKAMRRDAEIKG
jgi:UDP-N-acetylmuramate--alanine ligase